MIDVPCVTGALPGIGGLVRATPEDFEVDEIPAYLPSGEGDHVWVRIRKRGISTLDAVHRLARALDVGRERIGYAGLKDARAVTTQHLSVERVDPADVRALSLDGIEVLEVERHGNKLKRGHLRGNAFRVVVRGVSQGAVERAESILAVLVRRGLPNGFGPQRFGNAANGERLGAALWRGDGRAYFRELVAGVSGEAARRAVERLDAGDVEGAREALPSRCAEARALSILVRSRGDFERALPRLDRRLAELHLNALQAGLFNEVLAARMDSFDRLLDGDVAWLHRNGASFDVPIAAEEAARAEAFEISPTGPLPGPKCRPARGEPGRIEAEVLRRAELPPESRVFSRAVRGERRPLRVPVADASVRAAGQEAVELRFRLPPGAYATSVLREVTKSEAFNGRPAGLVDPAD